MTDVSPLTRSIAEFAAETRCGVIPESARVIVSNSVTDCVGCIIQGRNEPVARIVSSMISADERGQARVLFGRARSSVPEAALVNATAGHAHDFDDTGIGSHPAHPSVVIATALLAAGEPLQATGMDILASYVVGYEVWCELARRDSTPHNIAGWHPTAVFGPVAAAAAVANLMRLTANEVANALGMAASSAGGLIGNFGSMTKPLQVGWAARAGIETARLAKAGLTAAPGILEKDGGFLAVFSADGSVDRTSPVRLGEAWSILSQGPNIKLYPVCYSIHGAIDAMLDLCAVEKITPDAVVRIDVEVTPSQAANLFCHRPTDVTGAKFSAQFAIAAAAIAGRVTMVELSDSFVGRVDVVAFMRRVHMATVEPTQSSQSRKGLALRVTLRGGHEFAVPIHTPRGHAKKPPTRQDLWSKFKECVTGAMKEQQAEAMFEQLQRLDTLSGVDALPEIADAGANGPAASGP